MKTKANDQLQEKHMTTNGKIEGTVENWESGALGMDAAHAKPAPKELERKIDEDQGMQAISIRLRKDLIDDFKFIAKHHGMGYQPLMRQALKLFAESEFKRIAVQLYNEKAAKEEAVVVAQEPQMAQAA
jgi:uncharacterized protein (DUF4415 family)